MSDISQLLDKSLRAILSYLAFAIVGVGGTTLILSYGNVLAGVIFICLFVIVGIAFLFLVKYRRFLRVLSSGARRYYFTFPSSENEKVWPLATRSFKYLGISADSIGLRQFLDWTSRLPGNSSLTFSFLLMSPEGNAIALQKAHQKDRLPDDAEVRAAAEADRERIRSSITLLKTSPLYSAGRLQIRLYDEFVPWWMYVLDDDKVLLGILPRGGSGLEAPVLAMQRNKKYPSMFDPFMNTWERMWEHAENA